MRIVVREAEPARLEDADNFRDFRVTAPAGLSDAQIAASLADAAEKVDTAYAWIRPDWLKAGRDRSWLDQFESMAAFAATKGWVDAAGAIRAHIERG